MSTPILHSIFASKVQGLRIGLVDEFSFEGNVTTQCMDYFNCDI